ncbi:YkgJ family cysteine cluster protein [Salidesulfovibrio onnuriiensis]|uniref:YkgJ family cysteine cluster protein n=1 Tax=Salidesulfovibrio onnuriiensis TaxID=2583823 RepID=UPI0011C98167|nr:YkgJ family cysteine cluster protein [Salidesulfovibrio onnuriiensis]
MVAAVSGRGVREPGEEVQPSHPELADDPMGCFSLVGARCQEDMARTLNGDPSPGDVAQSVARANRWFDEALDSQEFSPPIACKRGCIHCCYNPVSLSQPEAVLLGLYLLAHWNEAELAALGRRAQTMASRIRGLSVEQMGEIRHELPCPLLMNGTCGAHSARPLVCRGWNSVDAGQCADSNAQGPMTMIESYEWPRTLAEAVQNGLLRGAREQGREVGFLRLANALVLMLEYGIEECVSGWLCKEPFFGRR